MKKIEKWPTIWPDKITKTFFSVVIRKRHELFLGCNFSFAFEHGFLISSLSKVETWSENNAAGTSLSERYHRWFWSFSQASLTKFKKVLGQFFGFWDTFSLILDKNFNYSRSFAGVSAALVQNYQRLYGTKTTKGYIVEVYQRLEVKRKKQASGVWVKSPQSLYVSWKNQKLAQCLLHSFAHKYYK